MQTEPETTTTSHASEPSPLASRAEAPSSQLPPHNLDDVGLASAGIAHELTNLLTIILGSTELARSQSPTDAAVVTHLDAVATAAQRAADLCRGVIACTERDAHDVTAIDVNRHLDALVSDLQAGPLQGCDVRFESAASSPVLSATPWRLTHLMQNLLRNAAEACEQPGARIRVTTSCHTLTRQQVGRLSPPAPRVEGPFVRLRVVDNGCGMSEDQLGTLGVRRSSTKAQNRGLGLVAVSQILRSLRGGMSVHSEPGRGTVVDVYLPLEPAALEDNSGHTPSAPASATKTKGIVLIADDEHMLRETVRSYLRTQGIDVDEADDGEAALERLSRSPEVDVLLLDVNMPGLGGLETMQEIRKRGHHTPVVLMTGIVRPEVLEEFEDLYPAEVLAKPYRLAELLQVVERYLPATRARAATQPHPCT